MSYPKQKVVYICEERNCEVEIKECFRKCAEHCSNHEWKIIPVVNDFKAMCAICGWESPRIDLSYNTVFNLAVSNLARKTKEELEMSGIVCPEE